MDTTISSLDVLIERGTPFIFALVLALARMMPIFQIFPVFSQLNIPASSRAIIALAMSVPVIMLIQPDAAKLLQSTYIDLFLLFAKEFEIGVLFGVLLAIPFWGVQTAGDIIDFSRSASAANLSDPVNASETSVTGKIMMMMSIAIFLGANGLFIVLDVIYKSYIAWPVAQTFPSLSMDAITLAGGILIKIFTMGVVIAGPIMIAMFVVDISLVFAVRAAKQFPVYDMSVTMKNFVFAFFFPYYGLLLSKYLDGNWKEALRFIYDMMRH